MKITKLKRTVPAKRKSAVPTKQEYGAELREGSRWALEPVDRAEASGSALTNCGPHLLHREESWIEQRDVDGTTR